MRKSDHTHKIEPTKFDFWLRRGGGNRKPPPVTMPHVRALEMPPWPAPGSEDTELGVLMGPEVDHGETEVHTRVQA